MRELHLFAGAGGGILGGMLLGHAPVGAVEIDPFARAVLHARQADGSLPDFPIYDDVRTFDGTQWRDRVDIIAGGFPCQDLSCAGKGAGIDGARSGLWWEMLRVIREARPRYVYLENVPAITGRGLDRVLGSLADLGFDADWLVLSAADAGAPHLRKRWWCLASDANAGLCGRTHQQIQARRDAAAVGCAHASESDGKRCEKRHAEERRVSEFDANRHAMADSESLQNRGRGRGSMDGSESSGEGLDAMPSACRSNVADADLAGREQQRSSVAAATARTAAERSGPAHTDTDGRRREEQRQPEQPDGVPRCAEGLAETEPRMGRAADGLAAWLDASRRLQASAWQAGWEDDCPRVVFGKPANRTNRLKALGNGQVPQTAAAAFRILWERLHR